MCVDCFAIPLQVRLVDPKNMNAVLWGMKNSPIILRYYEIRSQNEESKWGFVGAKTWVKMRSRNSKLGGGFKHFLFSPLFGEDSHFDEFFLKWVETTN